MVALLNFYKNLSIRRKIILIYLPLSLLPLMLFAYFSTHIYENSIINRTLLSAQDSSQLIVSQTESILKDADDCSAMLTININNVLTKNSINKNTYDLNIFNSISNELTYALLIFPELDSIAYYDINQRLHTSHPRLANNEQRIADSPLIATLKKTNGMENWFSMTRRNYLIQDPTSPVITLGKKVIDIQSGKTLGYLVINILESTLSKSFSDQMTLYTIVDEQGQIISSNQEKYVLTPFSNHTVSKYISPTTEILKVIETDNSRQLVSVMPFNLHKWFLVSEVDLDYLTKDLNEINLIILLLFGFITIAEIFSSNLLSLIITTPIKKLTEHVKEIASGNLDVYNEVNSTDEIGVLADGFNHMSFEIKGLLSRVKQEQKKKRTYELALIQEQIKPHFLYNCLDAIYALTLMNRPKEAAKTTKALADYYRLSLSNGQDVILLRDEIKNVVNYLELQKIRYADVFDYTVDIHDSIMTIPILKLTLQPIVENAIYHGLKPLDAMGHIHITSHLYETHVALWIEDNGVGMSQDKLSTLLSPSSRDKHFGLYNVYDRLKLFFGEGYGFTIESHEEDTNMRGTRVIITLPYESEVDALD